MAKREFLWKNWDTRPKDAPYLVMVHGFRGDHHGFLKIAENLKEEFNIIIPDLPGFGESAEWPDKKHTVDNYADWLAGFIKSQNLPQKPHVVAHSFGALIVAKMVAKHPEIVADKLVLLAPIASAQFNEKGQKRIAGFAQLLLKTPHGAQEKLARSKLITRFITWQHTETPDKQLKRWIKDEHLRFFGKFSSARSMFEAMNEAGSRRLNEDLLTAHNQALFLSGDKDKIAPIASVRNLAKQLRQTKLVEFPGHGHLIHYEKSTEIAQEIKKFLG